MISEIELINKLNKSVEFLKDKNSFKVGKFWIVPVADLSISINGVSNFLFKSNLSEEIVIKELNVLKDDFTFIKGKALMFIDYLSNKTVEYRLYLDYGMGSELLVLEKNGIVKIFL